MILLLSGWSNSGKSTVAELLSQQHQAKVYAFADELKNMVAEEFQFPFEWTQSQEGKQQVVQTGKTVRDLLIQRGQEIRAEKNDPGFFARQVAKKILKSNPSVLHVVSDWRLHVELETLKQELPDIHLFTVRIQRNGQVQSPVVDSLTEHELDSYSFDYVLKNAGKNKDALAFAITTMLFSLETSR
jgi:hypothetical protein